MVLATALLGLVAWRDIAVRLIPNWASGCVLLAGLGLRGLTGDVFAGLLAGGIVFAGAFLVWWFGLLGGGDVKLLGAAAVLVPPGDAARLLLGIALLGGVLAAGYILARSRLRRRPAGKTARPPGLLGRIARVEAWRIRRGGPLPYGVAIGAGTLCILAGA